jgi:hypothetical protein
LIFDIVSVRWIDHFIRSLQSIKDSSFTMTFKKKVLAAISKNNKPGPEIRALQNERDADKGFIHVLKQPLILCEDALKFVRDNWDRNKYGVDNQGEFDGEGMLEWTVHLKKISGFVRSEVDNKTPFQVVTDIVLMAKDDEEDFNEFCYSVVAVDLYHEALNAEQAEFDCNLSEGAFANFWMQERTLEEWCDDLVSLQLFVDRLEAKRDSVCRTLYYLGWDWKEDRWLKASSPVWKKLHDKIYPPAEHEAAPEKEAGKKRKRDVKESNEHVQAFVRWSLEDHPRLLAWRRRA